MGSEVQSSYCLRNQLNEPKFSLLFTTDVNNRKKSLESISLWICNGFEHRVLLPGHFEEDEGNFHLFGIIRRFDYISLMKRYFRNYTIKLGYQREYSWRQHLISWLKCRSLICDNRNGRGVSALLLHSANDDLWCCRGCVVDWDHLVLFLLLICKDQKRNDAYSLCEDTMMTSWTVENFRNISLFLQGTRYMKNNEAINEKW